MRQRFSFLSILIFFSFVATELFCAPHAYAIDIGRIYVQKKDSIVVIFNERDEKPEDSQKENRKKQPNFPIPKGDAPKAYAVPPVYTFRVQYSPEHTVVFSVGTGFIISEDGLVVTNAHVVRDAKQLTVELASGQVYQADLVGSETGADNDVAILKIRTTRRLQPLKLKIPDNIYVGKEALIIGHPYLYKFTAVEALISKVLYNPGLWLIQVQTSAHPGNSGSPVLADDGEVLGMIYSTVMGSETQALVIPAGRIQEIIQRILGRSPNH